MKKVLLCEPIHQEAYDLLNQNFNIIDDINKIDEVDAMIDRNIMLDKKMLDKCTNMKIIALHGTGTDDLDVEYSKEKGIQAFNIPGQNALSVAELIVGLILDVSRHISIIHRDMHQKCISLGDKKYAGNEISNKTVGLIGCGTIALKAANILKYGFHMNVVGYSPSLTLEKANKLNITYNQTIEEVCRNADILIVGCAYNHSTHHLINKDVLKYCKNTILINTTRGAVINEDDLLQALLNGQIKGAGLDVFEDEPISPNHPLLQLDNVICTNHIGATTDEALKRVGMKAVQGIIDYFEGKEVENLLWK